MNEMLEEIVELTASAGTRPLETGIPGLLMVGGAVPPHQLAALYEPMVGFVVRGIKVLSIGGQQLSLRGPAYFVLPMHVPVTGSVRQGRSGQAYRSVGLSLNRKVLRERLGDVRAEPSPKPPGGFTACEADPAFVEAWLRLLRLLRSPADVPALAPVYQREILYRVLRGPQGWYLRQLGFRDSNVSRIARTVASLRERYAEPIDIADMAKRANMAPSTFHRQFKRATGLSPIQFQKELRLLEARNLLVFEGYAAASAAYEVGYESASQFNREYSRYFGAPPARDAARVRRIEAARTA